MSRTTTTDADPSASTYPSAVGWALLVFFLALGVRSVCLWEVTHSVLGITLVGDGRQYDAWAREVAGGDWLGKEVFYQAPLYPYFLAVIYTLFGPYLLAVRIAQVVVGAVSCGLLVLAGNAFFSRRVGGLSGLFLSLYPPQIFFDLTIQKTVLDTFFLSGLLASLGQFQRGQRIYWLPIAGLLFGALTLTRENALVLIVVILAWLAVHPPVPILRRLGFSVCFLLGAGVSLVPVAVRNYVVGGELVLTTAQLGPNFYIGNNPKADGGYLPLRPGRGDPRYERKDATELAEEALGRKLAPGEVSRYWLDRALNFIFEQPGQWLRLLARKWFFVWGASEIVDTEGIEGYEDVSRLMRWLSTVMHFGVLCPLAAFGVVVTSRHWRSLWLLYGIILAIAVSVTLFYVFGRYRASLLPPVVLFAAAAFFPLDPWRALWGRALGALAAAILVAVYVNQPVGMAETNRSVTYYAHGKALLQLGRPAEAEVALLRAIEAFAEIADAHKLLASIRIQQGRPDEGITHLREAEKLVPTDPAVLSGLGTIFLQQGYPRDAASYLQRSLARYPHQAAAAVNLGRAWVELGKFEEAAAYFDKLAAEQPPSMLTKIGMAAALVGQNELEQARGHLDQVLAADPRNADARLELGKLRRAEGNSQEAEKELRLAVSLQPTLYSARMALAELELANGNTAAAIHDLRSILQMNPGYRPSLGLLALLYGTSSDPQYRHPALALRLAQEIMRRAPSESAADLGVLASAWAANDDFMQAEATAKRALQLALSEENAELQAELESNLQEYAAGRGQSREPSMLSFPLR